MATPQQKLIFTVEEYLKIERATDERHEYIDGRIRAVNWLLRPVSGLENSLHIESIGCTLRLAEVYDRVNFPSPTDEEAATVDGTSHDQILPE